MRPEISSVPVVCACFCNAFLFVYIFCYLLLHRIHVPIITKPGPVQSQGGSMVSWRSAAGELVLAGCGRHAPSGSCIRRQLQGRCLIDCTWCGLCIGNDLLALGCVLPSLRTSSAATQHRRSLSCCIAMPLYCSCAAGCAAAAAAVQVPCALQGGAESADARSVPVEYTCAEQSCDDLCLGGSSMRLSLCPSKSEANTQREIRRQAQLHFLSANFTICQ